MEYLAFQKYLNDCEVDINHYLLLSRREVERKLRLQLNSCEAHNVAETDAEALTSAGYAVLYKETCVIREKMRWALADRPYYLKKLLKKEVIAVRNVSQMKTLLGLKLKYNWRGRTKLSFFHGTNHERDSMKKYAAEWGLLLEPNTEGELRSGLAELRERERFLRTMLQDLATMVAAPDLAEGQYARLAAEANILRNNLRGAIGLIRSLSLDLGI